MSVKRVREKKLVCSILSKTRQERERECVGIDENNLPLKEVVMKKRRMKTEEEEEERLSRNVDVSCCFRSVLSPIRTKKLDRKQGQKRRRRKKKTSKRNTSNSFP